MAERYCNCPSFVIFPVGLPFFNPVYTSLRNIESPLAVKSATLALPIPSIVAEVLLTVKEPVSTVLNVAPFPVTLFNVASFPCMSFNLAFPYLSTLAGYSPLAFGVPIFTPPRRDKRNSVTSSWFLEMYPSNIR
ncbi:hypothetical protein BF10P2_00002 [Bacteroides phage BF10P2]|nr:hypothetical protein BF10P2_00002 [Bacteroides phage BF10P2]